MVAKKVKLQWIEWITAEISEENVQKVLNAFYKTEAGKSIEIERQAMPYEPVHDKVITLNLAGQVPDLINMNPAWVVEFAEQGVAEPLNKYLDKAGKDWVANVVPGSMVPWKGNIYVVTLTSIPYVMYYNEKKLAEAGLSGPPKTWADVESMGPKLTNPAKNTYCYASQMGVIPTYGGPGIELYNLVYTANDTVLKDGKSNLKSPAALKALKFWLHLVYDLKIYAPGVLTNAVKEVTEAFAAEQTALYWQNTAHIIIMEKRNPNLKFGVAPLPEGDSYGTTIHGWSTAMGRGSKNKDAAWEFIYWLSSPEGNAILTKAAKHLPGNIKADVSEMLAADARLQVCVDVIKRGRGFQESSVMPEAVNMALIFTEQVHEVANKRKTPEEALDFTHTAWNKIFAKYT